MGWEKKIKSKHPNTFKQIFQQIYQISQQIYQISQHINQTSQRLSNFPTFIKYPDTFIKYTNIHQLSWHVYQISQHLSPSADKSDFIPSLFESWRGKGWEIPVKLLRFSVKYECFGLERTLKTTRILVFRSITSAGVEFTPFPPCQGQENLGKSWRRIPEQLCPTGRIPFPPSQTISLLSLWLFSHFSHRDLRCQSLWFNSWG